MSINSDMSMNQILFFEIKKKIYSMIADHKFNLYQLKQYKDLYRGNESGEYQNVEKSSEWGKNSTYEFKYYYFYQGRATNPAPFEVTLAMRYYSDNDDFKVGLMFQKKTFIDCLFPHNKLLENGYSIERIIEDFENIFLEIPFCELYLYPTAALKVTEERKIAEYYRWIAHEYHTYMTHIIKQKNHALAMYSHKSIQMPDEILRMIAQHVPPTYVPTIYDLFST